MWQHYVWRYCIECVLICCNICMMRGDIFFMEYGIWVLMCGEIRWGGVIYIESVVMGCDM